MSVAAQVVERSPEPMPVQVISKAGTYMANIDSIPWTPFVFPKTFFKLLHLNEDRGSVTLLLLAEKGAPTPIHKHIGAAEIYVLRGSFTYEEGTAHPNYYVHEAGGVVHVAEANEEIMAFVVFHGPLVGYNEDGSVSGVCDCDVFYELAKQNGAVGHLPLRT